MRPETPADEIGPEPPSRSMGWSFRARAWWGDRQVAESDATIRVEEPGRPSALYFPCADVAFDLFHDEGHRVSCPVKGAATLWSIEGTGVPAGTDPKASPTTWWGDDDAASDGSDVVWSFSDPAPAVAWLADHACFDHDRVRVEIIEAPVGDEPGTGSVTRFPNWGDAADLIGMLDVRPDGDGRYVSTTHTAGPRPVVEGSQMLAQSLVAAGRYSGGRRPVSTQMVFTRAADAALPLQFELDEVAHGRTFTALSVRVTQGERCCAAGTVLLDESAPDVIRHEVSPPDVAGPHDSPAYDMSVTGRDLRIVDAAYTDAPDAPVGEPVIDAWVRFREVPDDPCLHAALLAQFSGHMSIATAMRPHEGVSQYQAHRTLSTAINAISISFHADVRADRWMLYRHLSTFAGDGMTHSECRVHDEAGALLASFTVDAMVRKFVPSPHAVDHRTSL